MRFAWVVAASCLAIAPAHADRVAGFGLGGEIGHPTGLTIAQSLGDKLELHAGVGTGLLRGTGLHLYGDVVFYAAKLGDSAWFYFGGGLRFWDAHYDPVTRYDAGRDTHFGIRIPLGFSFYSNSFEFFVQAGPVADLIYNNACSRFAPSRAACNDQHAVDLIANVGVRYYFGRKK